MSFWSNSVETDLVNLRAAVPFHNKPVNDQEIVMKRLIAYIQLGKDHTEAALATLLFLKREDKTDREKTLYFYCLLEHLTNKHSRRLLPYLKEVINISPEYELDDEVKKSFHEDLQKWNTNLWHRKDLRAGYSKVLEFISALQITPEQTPEETLFSLIIKIGQYYRTHVSPAAHRHSLNHLDTLKTQFGITETLSALKYFLEQESSIRLLKWIELAEQLVYPDQKSTPFPATDNQAYQRLLDYLDTEENRTHHVGIHLTR